MARVAMPMVGMKNIINAAAMNGYNVRLVSSNAPRNVAEGEREREGGGEEKIADNVAEEKGETIGKTLVEREQQPKKTIQKKTINSSHSSYHDGAFLRQSCSNSLRSSRPDHRTA